MLPLFFLSCQGDGESGIVRRANLQVGNFAVVQIAAVSQQPINDVKINGLDVTIAPTTLLIKDARVDLASPGPLVVDVVVSDGSVSTTCQTILDVQPVPTCTPSQKLVTVSSVYTFETAKLVPEERAVEATKGLCVDVGPL